MDAYEPQAVLSWIDQSFSAYHVLGALDHDSGESSWTREKYAQSAPYAPYDDICVCPMSHVGLLAVLTL